MKYITILLCAILFAGCKKEEDKEISFQAIFSGTPADFMLRTEDAKTVLVDEQVRGNKAFDLKTTKSTLNATLGYTYGQAKVVFVVNGVRKDSIYSNNSRMIAASIFLK